MNWFNKWIQQQQHSESADLRQGGPDPDPDDFQNLIGISLSKDTLAKFLMKIGSLQTNKQTNRQTDKRRLLHNLLCGVNSTERLHAVAIQGTFATEDEFLPFQLFLFFTFVFNP